ncbi:hypothetical protein, partial [Desulfobulbus elongatus]|uniref:hypothetical protein n=1 Tax=Desulfobulbus elongatus TaxID=53332 RepID=UPI0012FC685E
MNRDLFSLGNRLWVDWNESIIGFETDTEYYFARFVCLPMTTVDDLDMVGTQYREAYVKDSTFDDWKQEKVASGYVTTLEPGDPRIYFRYDPVRFFKRFEQYGITPMLMVPDTKPREAWDGKTQWNTMFKVMPLGTATTLDDLEGILKFSSVIPGSLYRLFFTKIMLSWCLIRS